MDDLSHPNKPENSHPSFSDVPLSQESSITFLPGDESDPDTLVSDSEDQELLRAYHPNPRPSFTIGGSDSDSTSAFSESDGVHIHPRKVKQVTSALKSIPSEPGTLAGDSLPQGRPGYMGGPSSRSGSR